MAENSKIEWTDATWNPITGCSVVSPGCANCYAMKLAGTRLKHSPSRQGLTMDSKAGPVWNGKVRLNEQWLDQPLRWTKPRRIFVCAHGDLFHENVPDKWIDQVFVVMAWAEHHTFQVLTKRPRRMRDYFSTRTEGDPWAEAADAVADLRQMQEHPFIPEPRDFPLPNVWLGVSVEDQARADERIPHLLAVPAAKRFLSVEPLLGPVDLTRVCLVPKIEGSIRAGIHIDALAGHYVESGLDYIGEWDIGGPAPTDWPKRCIDWTIVGGESGPKARPMHPDWARSLRDQCVAAGVPFFFKQHGDWCELGQLPWRNPGWDRVTPIGATPIKGTLVRREDVPEHPMLGGRAFETVSLDQGCLMIRVGKKAAGASLDGREWREMPT